MQDCSISDVLAMEILQSCTKPSKWYLMSTVCKCCSLYKSPNYFIKITMWKDYIKKKVLWEPRHQLSMWQLISVITITHPELKSSLPNGWFHLINNIIILLNWIAWYWITDGEVSMRETHQPSRSLPEDCYTFTMDDVPFMHGLCTRFIRNLGIWPA